MDELPHPRRPVGDLDRDACWDEFWSVMVDAIAEAKIREARGEISKG